MGYYKKVKEESVKIALDIKRGKDREDYYYPWYPLTGNALYAMPEEGERVMDKYGYALNFKLIIRNNVDILEIRYEKKRIVIKSLKENFENWKALHIIPQKADCSLDYNVPLMANLKRYSFIRRYAENSRGQFMKKTNLFRRIRELYIWDYIEVAGYEISENARDYPNIEGMNWLVRDELFPMESRKVLLLKFKERRPGHYIRGKMVRFVVSQMPLEIREYWCVKVIA